MDLVNRPIRHFLTKLPTPTNTRLDSLYHFYCNSTRNFYLTQKRRVQESPNASFCIFILIALNHNV